MPTYAEALRNANINTGVNNALRLGLLMFGLGAGARGLQGLVNLGRRNLQRPSLPSFTDHVIQVPIRDDAEEKTASDPVTDYVVNPITDAFKGNVSEPGAWPLSLPLALTATGTGIFGGYKLTDWLMDQRRKSQLQEELDDAKQRYEAALTGKSALAQDLDALYDAYTEKQGSAADNWGRIIGGGLTIGLPLGLISGLITYDMTKKRTPSEVLRKAKQKRLRELTQRQPPAVYARPAYQAGSADVPTEDELAGEPLDKAAVAKRRAGLARLKAAGWVCSPTRGWVKRGFDAPGGEPPALPVELPPNAKPPYGPDGSAAGGAAQMPFVSIEPGSTSNHPATVSRRPKAGAAA